MKYTKREVKAFSKASAIAQEVLGSIRTVTAFGGQKKEEARYGAMTEQGCRTNRRVRLDFQRI